MHRKYARKRNEGPNLMPRPVDEPLTAIQLRLFKADLEKLRHLYGDTLGVNKAIRNIVRAFIRQTEAKANAIIDAKEAEGARAALVASALVEE